MSSVSITKEILQTLTDYTRSLENEVHLVLQTGKYNKRDELVTFLSEICSVSEKLKFSEKDFKGNARSPLTFFLEVNGKGNGCLLYTSPSPRDATLSRMPSSA